MKLEMQHTVNIVIELKTELPCAAGYPDGSLCGDTAVKALATLADFGTWEIVPLCEGCFEQVKPDLIDD